MILGVRFGAHSCTLAMQASNQSQAEVIANEDGDRVIPTCLSFNGGDVFTGNIARTQLVRNAKNTIASFMELLGLRFDHPLVAYHQKHDAVEIGQSRAFKGGVILPLYHVTHNDKDCTYTPEEVTALFLKALVKTAEGVSGERMKQLVLTVPAHFEGEQREALARAAQLHTRVKKVTLVDEPAAVLAGYEDILPVSPPKESTTADSTADDNAEAMMKAHSTDRNVMIVDIGGRSADITCLAVRSGVVVVVAHERDEKLGGRLLDDVLAKHFAQEFYRKTRLDVFENKRASTKLHLACEQTKKTLSQAQNSHIHIESLHEGVDLNGTINRMRFEMMCNDFLQSTKQLLKKALTGADWQAEHVDEVLLVGGCSRIPCVQAAAKDVFSQFTPVRHQQVDPLEVAAIGAVREALCRGNVDEGQAADVHPPALSKTLGCIALSADNDPSSKTFVPLLQKSHPLPAKRLFAVDWSANQKSLVFAVVEEGDMDKILASLRVERPLMEDGQVDETATTILSVDISVDGELTLAVGDGSARE